MELRIKRSKIILTTVILVFITGTIAANQLLYDNPADISAYYYSQYGVYLGYQSNSIYTWNENTGSINLHYLLAARNSPVLYNELSYHNTAKTFTYSGTIAKRYSAKIIGGIEIQGGYSAAQRDTQIAVKPGIIYRKTGNFHYGIENKTRVLFSDETKIINIASALLRVNLNGNHSFIFELNQDSDFFISYSNLSNPSFKLKLGIHDFIKNSRDHSLGLQVNFQVNRHRLTTAVRKTNEYEYNIGFSSRVGSYKPPVSFPLALFPVVKTLNIKHALGIKQMADRLPEQDIVIKVKRGDNLTKISRSLPVDSDSYYNNNVSAIALYNNINTSSVLRIGQELRIPAKSIKTIREFTLSDKDKSIVEQVTAYSKTSELTELILISSLWNRQLSVNGGLHSMLPVRAEIENSFLLNTQSIAEIENRNYKGAIRKLKFALMIDESCPVINANLALALYLDNQQGEAVKYYLRSKELAKNYNLNFDVLSELEKKR